MNHLQVGVQCAVIIDTLSVAQYLLLVVCGSLTNLFSISNRLLGDLLGSDAFLERVARDVELLVDLVSPLLPFELLQLFKNLWRFGKDHAHSSELAVLVENE